MGAPNPADIRHRAVGAVLGSAVGDALGAPFEFGPAGGYSARFPEPVVGGIGEMVGGGGFGWAPGEFTDDTQMAVVQAESILASGGVDGADLFDRFRVWASTANDVGVQTSAVLRSSRPWSEAAAGHYRANPTRGAGNGSLMRSTPTAVHFAAATLDETIEAAQACSAITHGDPAAGWGTAIHHVMIRAAVRGDDPFAALADILERLPDDQARYRRMLAPDWTPDRMEVPNGSVWGCVAQAVWAVRTTHDFADAVIAAIDLGGDTDTVAAIAGGLAGAIHGVQAIPSRWATYVHGHVTTPDGPATYDAAALQELAIRLVGGTPAAMAPLGSGAGPTEIAPRLFAADLTAAAATPTDHAVISLCRTDGHLDDHPVRRSVFLIDQHDANPGLRDVTHDVVDTIDAFLDEGRTVVVHCHHGQSRTGFVLRAWLMRHHGWDEPTATAHLAEQWPHLGLHNDDFTRFLTDRWPGPSDEQIREVLGRLRPPIPTVQLRTDTGGEAWFAPEYAGFAEHRTREELDQLLHHGHIIPISRGLTQEYVATQYPGWTWNRLLEVFGTAGIVVGRGGAPPKCDDRVRAFHWTDATHFAVEWDDDDETAD